MGKWLRVQGLGLSTQGLDFRGGGRKLIENPCLLNSRILTEEEQFDNSRQ